MQRVCAVRGGVGGYLRDPKMLVTEETRRCPYCPGAHGMSLHGWYFRQAILPAGGGCVRVPVRRLLCAATGRTVSLLPDFCLPRRQHGPAVLGLFLVNLFLHGRTLVESLRRARGEVPSHGVAQSLRDGFRSRCGRISEYLDGAGRTATAGEPPSGVVGRLRAGYRQVRLAFVRHGRAMHQASGLGLA